MKRYFTFATPPDHAVYQPRGMYHYTSLPGSGFVCVVDEESADVPADWTELPHLLESVPANFNGIGTTPGPHVASASAPVSPIAGIAPTDTTFQLAKKLAKLNRHFHP